MGVGGFVEVGGVEVVFWGVNVCCVEVGLGDEDVFVCWVVGEEGFGCGEDWGGCLELGVGVWGGEVVEGEGGLIFWGIW